MEKTTMSQAEFCIIDVSAGPDSEHYPLLFTNRGPNVSEDACRTSQLWLRRIHKGTCSLGSPEDEFARFPNEKMQKVTLTHDFMMGIFPVTQRQWELVTGRNPSYFTKQGPTAPVDSVSYVDICGNHRKWPCINKIDEDSFLGMLRLRTGCRTVDLPTEAQWEYACRAGCAMPLNNGTALADIQVCPNLDCIAWYRGNSGGATHPVGMKAPNAWGLYDMQGNVLEWTRDWYGDDTSPEVQDPEGIPVGNRRTIRGGAWNCRAGDCRAARRFDDGDDHRGYDIGFRLMMDI